MGNSVQDWNLGSTNRTGFRDRYRYHIDDIDTGAFWQDGGTPSKSLYAAGRQTRMQDFNQLGFRSLMRLRDKVPAVRSLDLGHAMALESTVVSMPTKMSTKALLTGNVYQHYDGIYFPSVSYKTRMASLAAGSRLAIPSALGTDLPSLWSYGSTAIARSIPDIPDFSLPRFIGELREGLPKIPLRQFAKEKKLRSVGGEYLNYQFGIMPTVSDLEKLFQLLLSPRAQKVIERQLDHEFRVRKVIDKGTVSTTTDLSSSSEANTLTLTWRSNTKLIRKQTTSYRVWSSCSFKYFQVNRLQQLINDLERQLGLGLQPTALDAWNLVPWSWFVDWFTNLDDVITNLSYLGKNGLYMHHGYVMGSYEDVTEERQTCNYMGKPVETIGRTSYKRKYRVKACPFGFGLSWKDFTPFQLSILGALGTSRLRF